VILSACDHRGVPDAPKRPPRRIWLAGRLVAWIVAIAPGAWPLMRAGVERFFDGAATGWDSRTDTGSAGHLEGLATATLRVGLEPERILEIGCGTGAGSFFLAREFPQARVRGLDLSSEMIRRATRKSGLDPEARVAFRVGDASSLPWKESSFDMVAQINMPVFFSEVERVLRPGGVAIITSSLGPDTPFFTPAKTLRRGFSKVGMVTLDSGTAGRGSWLVATKTGQDSSQ
jgi:ubiquinone/menaquinone biosynthesis C-methylase UbiE